MGRSADPRDDPFAVLGLTPGAGVDAINAARRSLAKQSHPDSGGSIASMQQVNAAAEAALALAAADTPAGRSRSAPRGRRRNNPPAGGGVRHDHPSFTIEALPAEAFEGLLIAATILGDVVDEDPPDLLEVIMTEPVPAWCRLDLVSDAGAATVSITTARLSGHPVPDVLEVRDGWIDALNRLDWSQLGEQPPS